MDHVYTLLVSATAVVALLALPLVHMIGERPIIRRARR